MAETLPTAPLNRVVAEFLGSATKQVKAASAVVEAWDRRPAGLTSELYDLELTLREMAIRLRQPSDERLR